MSTTPPPHGRPGVDRRARVLSWVADVAVVTVFVAIGRRSHDEGAGGFFVTALPFLAALQTAWLIGPPVRPAHLRFGVVVWGVTVAVGLLLRVLTGDGAAIGFIVVTTLALGFGLIGWRLVVRAAVAVRRRRPRP